MGQITHQINSIRINEKKSIRKIFKEKPELVEKHKDEMWNDWENLHILEDDPQEYVLYPRYDNSRKEKKEKWNNKKQ